MKALVLTDYNKFEIRDVPKPQPKENEVLVRVKACGICGSDVHGMNGSSGRRIPPVIMGHEAAGVIAEVGHAVSQWKPGDRVAFDSTIYCGQCIYCRAGRPNLCDRREVLGVSCSEFRRDGAFAEFVAVPEHILVPLPDNVPYSHAALLEPLAVAAHAVARAQVAIGDNALVIGAGVIGLLIIQLLSISGCTQIVAVDIAADRLEIASRLGATATVNPDSVEQAVGELIGTQGVDLVFEAVGLEATVKSAIQLARKGGTVVLVGNLQPAGTLPMQQIVTKELNVFGSYASAGEFARCLQLLQSKRIDIGQLISAEISLQEAPEYFARLYRKEPGLLKVVVTL